MADQTFSFGNGATFNSSGVAQNAQATTDLASLGVKGNAYSGYVPPNTSTPVPTSNLTASPVNLPPANNIPDPTGKALVGSTGNLTAPSMADTGDYTQDPTYKAAQAKYDQSISDFSAGVNSLPSQAGLLTDAQNQTGATDSLKQLSSMKTELAQLQAQYANAYQNVETKGITSGTPAPFYQGEQAAIQRQQAVVVASKAAQVQAAQGNYDAAEQLAEKTASLKFADAQQKIDNLKTFIQLNQENLSQAEKLSVSKMQAQAVVQQRKIDEQKAALSFALTNNVSTPFYQVGGTIYRSSDGKAYSTPKDFFADGGAQDFGNVQVVSQANNAEKDMVLQYANKYPDAGIKINDSIGEAQQKVSKSAIFRKETYIAPTGGSGGGGGYIPGANATVDAYIQQVKAENATLTNVPANLRGLVAQGLSQGSAIVDSATDQQVRAIIAANPDNPQAKTGWGSAADAINALAPGTDLASKYDAQLKAVYANNQDVSQAFTSDTYTPLAGSRFALEATRITAPFTKLPVYEAASQAQVYLPRIAAAYSNPGTVGDAELLDSIVKLNTGGNAITNEQVNLITGYGSYADKLNVFKNKFDKGGALSTDQRAELYNIAQQTNQKYQAAYQPVYDQATKQLEQAGVPQQFWTIPDLNTLSNQGQNSNQPQEGQTGIVNGSTYKFTNGNWVQQ